MIPGMLKALLPSLGASAVLFAVPALAGDAGRAADWSIGPVIDGRNYSVGMPATLSQGEGGQVWFDFPGPTARDGHVHYLTHDPGSLAGARGVRLRYRIEAAPGVRFVPQEAPGREALLSLYLQRRGDDWRARGGTEWYRWYAPWQSRLPLEPGTHEVTVLFDAEWTSVNGKKRSDAPRQFSAALAEAGRVGFTLGSDRGLGHGFSPPGPRLTVFSYQILR